VIINAGEGRIPPPLPGTLFTAAQAAASENPMTPSDKPSSPVPRPLLDRLHDLLATLTWLRKHRHDHLLPVDEFDRQEQSAWTDAEALTEETARRCAAPKREPLDRVDLGRSLGDAIRDYIHGEGGLIAYAREVRNDDPNVPLSQETPEAVGEILWSETSAGDMAHAARISGAITALFDLARWLDIELPEEIQALEEWGDTIYPA